MKTALLTATHMIGTDPSGSHCYERAVRFISWHYGFFDKMFSSDNASPLWCIQELRSKCTFLSYQDHLTRGPGENEYPYCWRTLYTMKILIRLGYDKIIFLDSDCFIVSKRMLDYVNSIQTGWESFWVPKYGFPSAEFHVLCKDAFPIYEEFTNIPYADHMPKLMETALPFTKVNKDFKTDRWGEDRTPQTAEMDAYFQAPVNHPLRFSS